MEENKEKKATYRVVSFLDREELDFLDSLGKDIYFSKGINIPRTKLIEEIIDIFKAKDTQDRKLLEDELMRLFKDTEAKKE